MIRKRKLTSQQLIVLRLSNSGYAIDHIAQVMVLAPPTIRQKIAAIDRGIGKDAFEDCEELRKRKEVQPDMFAHNAQRRAA